MDITYDIISFIEDYNEKCKVLRKGFYELEQRMWTNIMYWSELSIQLQHFIFATSNNKNKNKIKESFRDISNVEDEICDVIYQLINILKSYNLRIDRNMFCDLEYTSEMELKEICIVLSGQIGDAILRIEHYKHSSTQTVFSDKELIRNNCFYIMCLMFEYAYGHGINIRYAFDKMLEDAKNYIISFNNYFSDGVYSSIERDEMLVKSVKLNNENTFSLKIDKDFILDEVRLYIDQLNFKKISVVKPLRIEKQNDNIIMNQLYIKGLRLDDFIKVYINYREGIGIIKNIFIDIVTDILLLYKNNPHIRVDTNLCNFIIGDIASSKVTINLVDVYPPIFINKISMANNENSLIYDLITDINVSIIAFLYYFIKNILIGIQDGLEYELINMIHETIHQLVDFTESELEIVRIDNSMNNLHSKNYFISKINRMLEYFSFDQNGRRMLIEEMKLWSVRKENKE